VDQVAHRHLRFEFLRDGALTLYFRREGFDTAVEQLRVAGYRIHVIDATDPERFCEQMTRALRFKENFGYEPWTGNLDALVDAFREVFSEEDCPKGAVFAFVGFDRYLARDKRAANIVLDTLEYQSRDCLLHGLGLIGLVQSDDPSMILEPTGGRTPQWNRAEWLDSARRI
jgi:hypothetical protein